MSDLRNLSREFLTEFIELYRSFPSLWKTKSKEYMDRSKKNQAYNVLLSKLKDVEKSATIDSVKSKINTLRGGFRREFKKVLESKRSGAGEDEVYVPTLWYYDLLLFVRDQEMPRPSVSNIGSDNDEGRISDQEEITSLDETRCSLSVPSSSSSMHVSEIGTSDPREKDTLNTPSSTFKRITRKRKTRSEEQADDVLTLVQERLRASSSEDEFSISGKNFACKLRSLPRETRLYTEKLMNELLFEAQMGNVNRHTKIVYPPSHNFDSNCYQVEPVPSFPPNMQPFTSNNMYSYLGQHLPPTPVPHIPRENSIKHQSFNTPSTPTSHPTDIPFHRNT